MESVRGVNEEHVKAIRRAIHQQRLASHFIDGAAEGIEKLRHGFRY